MYSRIHWWQHHDQSNAYKYVEHLENHQVPHDQAYKNILDIWLNFFKDFTECKGLLHISTNHLDIALNGKNPLKNEYEQLVLPSGGGPS